MRLSVLDTGEIDNLINAAMEIVEETGAVIDHRDALNLLVSAGARIETDNRILIPRILIEQAISSAPSTITIYDRLGNVAMVLDGKNSYFGAHAWCPLTIEPLTGKRHTTTLDDIAKVARVIDALPNIAHIDNSRNVAGVNPNYGDVAMFATVIQNTSKPILIDLMGSKTGAMILDIARASISTSYSITEKPFVVACDSPISFQYHPEGPVNNLMWAARQSIPFVYNPMPQGGLTAPTTMAGVLIVTLAEVLTGLVISQLVRPGAPFIFGGVPSIFNMRDATFVYGSPELFLMCSALTEIVDHMKLPSFGTAGMTDSKQIDFQAGAESSLSTLMAVLSKSGFVHDIGLIDSGLAHSLPMVVLVDEIIEMIRHLERGIEVSSDTIAKDVISRVGPKGNFLGDNHTLTHFRECWYSKNFDHTSGRGKKEVISLEARVQKNIETINETHCSAPLPSKALELIASLRPMWESE